MKKKKTVYYVDNKDFLAKLTEFQRITKKAKKEGKPLPKPSDAIGLILLNIARGVASRPNFAKYPYREELISDGLIDAVQALGKFDVETRDNPFAYFTTVIWNAFLHRIRDEKREQYIVYKLTEQSFIEGSLVGADMSESVDGKFNGVIEDNDFRDDFVSTYEKHIAEKREKAKRKKASVLEDVFLYDEDVKDLDESSITS